MTSRQQEITNKYLDYRTNLQQEDPDNIYLDILITNVGSYTTSPPAITFNEARQSPFLRHPEKYEMSIIRFQADTSTLPVFIPVIQPNQSDPNLTIYSITMSFQLNSSTPYYEQQTFIEFVPQNTQIPAPVPPSQTSNGLQTPSQYYFYYNYQSFIYIIYNAFQKCFNDLNTQTGNYLVTNGAIPPTINWDVDTGKAVLYFQTQYYNTTGSNPSVPLQYNVIKVFFNTPLYYLFNSFVFLNRGDLAINGKNYQIVIGSFGTVNTITLPITSPTGTVCDVLFQEYSTSPLMTPITSICFTSSLLPIISTQLTAPLLFNNGSIVQNTPSTNGTNANFINQITDITLQGDQYIPNILYNPTAQYRFISLSGSSPLNQIDVQVYWKDRLGTFYPVYLQSGGSCTLKIYFRKKRYLIQDSK